MRIPARGMRQSAGSRPTGWAKRSELDAGPDASEGDGQCNLLHCGSARQCWIRSDSAFAAQMSTSHQTSSGTSMVPMTELLRLHFGTRSGSPQSLHFIDTRARIQTLFSKRLTEEDADEAGFAIRNEIS